MTRPLDELFKLPDEALVDDREAALVLDLSSLALRDWRSQRRGPAHRKLCGAVRSRVGDPGAFRGDVAAASAA